MAAGRQGAASAASHPRAQIFTRSRYETVEHEGAEREGLLGEAIQRRKRYAKRPLHSAPIAMPLRMINGSGSITRPILSRAAPP